MKTKTKLKFLGLISIFLFSFLIYYFLSISHIDISIFFNKFSNSPFTPFFIILLVAIQVIFAPIPGQFAGLLSEYMFGSILGTVYSMIGLTIGSWIVFYIARKLGRPFVISVVNKKNFKKYDSLIEKKGELALFVLYLLPALPDDLISYIAGLTNIKISRLLIISFLGRLPGFFILNYIGSGQILRNDIEVVVCLFLFILISLAYFLYREKFENLIVSKLKNE